MEIDAPSHAVGLWIEGDAFVVRFPDRQLIKIPFQDASGEPYSGSQRLVQMLRQRESMGTKGQKTTVGTLGAPVQYDIDRGEEGISREDLNREKAVKAVKAAAKRHKERERLAREREGDDLLELTGLMPRATRPAPQLRKRA